LWGRSGKSSDPTAVAIVEQIATLEGKSMYHVRHLERLKLGTSYPAIVHHVKGLTESPTLRGEVTLALDYTGVGRPVADMFLTSDLRCSLYAITIHGEDAVKWDGWQIRVPKRDLIGATQVLLQGARIKIASSLPEAAVLVKELLNFKVKIDPVTSHDSYRAWREGIHDDLVLSLALACWIGENQRRAGTFRR
jgi:hypothetical protein